MKQETEDAIKRILEVEFDTDHSEAFAAIIAAVDRERVGEVVLWYGEILGNYVSICGPNFNELRKKKGRLIFVPEGESK